MISLKSSNELPVNTSLTILGKEFSFPTRIITVFCRDPVRSSYRNALYRAFHHWSTNMLYIDKCHEMYRQLRERTEVLQNIRECYLRDVISVKYHLQLNTSKNKKSPSKQSLKDELESIPSIDLRQYSIHSQTSESSKLLQESLIQSEMPDIVSETLAEYNKHPWEQSESFKTLKIIQTRKPVIFPTGGHSIEIFAPKKFKLYIKYCQSCIGIMTLIHDWNETVGKALKYTYDNDISQSKIIHLNKTVTDLTHLVHSQQENIDNLMQKLELVEKTTNWFSIWKDGIFHENNEDSLRDIIFSLTNISQMAIHDKDSLEFNLMQKYEISLNLLIDEIKKLKIKIMFLENLDNKTQSQLSESLKLNNTKDIEINSLKNQLEASEIEIRSYKSEISYIESIRKVEVESKLDLTNQLKKIQQDIKLDNEKYKKNIQKLTIDLEIQKKFNESNSIQLKDYEIKHIQQKHMIYQLENHLKELEDAAREVEKSSQVQVHNLRRSLLMSIDLIPMQLQRAVMPTVCAVLDRDNNIYDDNYNNDNSSSSSSSSNSESDDENSGIGYGTSGKEKASTSGKEISTDGIVEHAKTRKHSEFNKHSLGRKFSNMSPFSSPLPSPLPLPSQGVSDSSSNNNNNMSSSSPSASQSMSMFRKASISKLEMYSGHNNSNGNGNNTSGTGGGGGGGNHRTERRRSIIDTLLDQQKKERRRNSALTGEILLEKMDASNSNSNTNTNSGNGSGGNVSRMPMRRPSHSVPILNRAPSFGKIRENSSSNHDYDSDGNSNDNDYNLPTLFQRNNSLKIAPRLKIVAHGIIFILKWNYATKNRNYDDLGSYGQRLFKYVQNKKNHFISQENFIIKEKLQNLEIKVINLTTEKEIVDIELTELKHEIVPLRNEIQSLLHQLHVAKDLYEDIIHRNDSELAWRAYKSDRTRKELSSQLQRLLAYNLSNIIYFIRQKIQVLVNPKCNMSSVPDHVEHELQPKDLTMLMNRGVDLEKHSNILLRKAKIVYMYNKLQSINSDLQSWNSKHYKDKPIRKLKLYQQHTEYGYLNEYEEDSYKINNLNKIILEEFYSLERLCSKLRRENHSYISQLSVLQERCIYLEDTYVNIYTYPSFLNNNSSSISNSGNNNNRNSRNSLLVSSRFNPQHVAQVNALKKQIIDLEQLNQALLYRSKPKEFISTSIQTDSNSISNDIEKIPLLMLNFNRSNSSNNNSTRTSQNSINSKLITAIPLMFSKATSMENDTPLSIWPPPGYILKTESDKLIHELNGNIHEKYKAQIEFYKSSRIEIENKFDILFKEHSHLEYKLDSILISKRKLEDSIEEILEDYSYIDNQNNLLKIAVRDGYRNYSKEIDKITNENIISSQIMNSLKFSNPSKSTQISCVVCALRPLYSNIKHDNIDKLPLDPSLYEENTTCTLQLAADVDVEHDVILPTHPRDISTSNSTSNSTTSDLIKRIIRSPNGHKKIISTLRENENTENFSEVEYHEGSGRNNIHSKALFPPPSPSSCPSPRNGNTGTGIATATELNRGGVDSAVGVEDDGIINSNINMSLRKNDMNHNKDNEHESRRGIKTTTTTNTTNTTRASKRPSTATHIADKKTTALTTAITITGSEDIRNQRLRVRPQSSGNNGNGNGYGNGSSNGDNNAMALLLSRSYEKQQNQHQHQQRMEITTPTPTIPIPIPSSKFSRIRSIPAGTTTGTTTNGIGIGTWTGSSLSNLQEAYHQQQQLVGALRKSESLGMIGAKRATAAVKSSSFMKEAEAGVSSSIPLRDHHQHHHTTATTSSLSFSKDHQQQQQQRSMKQRLVPYVAAGLQKSKMDRLT